ncbi:hypothetical protein SAMD00019534_074470, partial [Acytostelium subglobosum LB1]|uniref:hypothetical protein n=1 Tax=Acytostelium subglobosum LB1 TaxID=1410327 RepID=UPI0006451684
MTDSATRVHYITQRAGRLRCYNRPFHNDYALFATGSNQKCNNIALWSIDTRSQSEEPEQLCAFPVGGLDHNVTDMRFVDIRGVPTIVYGDSDGSLTLLSVSDLPAKCIQPAAAHHKHNKQQQNGEDSDSAAANTRLTKQKRWEHAHRGGINSIDNSFDNEHIATVGSDGSMNIFSHEYDQPIYTNKKIDGLSINAVRYMSNNELITSGVNSVLKFWDIRSGSNSAPIKTIKQVQSQMSTVHCIAVHHDQPHIIATGNADGYVSIFDFRNSFSIDQNRNHTSNVWEVSFSRAKSSQVYSCSEDGSVYLYDYNRDNKMTSANMFDVYNKVVQPVISSGLTASSIDSFDINTSLQTLICSS